MDENINRFRIGMIAKMSYWSLFTWKINATLQNAWVLHKKSGNKPTEKNLMNYHVHKSSVCGGENSN
jgi:hypothetical protein